MYRKRNYYILDKPSWSFSSIIFSVLKIPFSLPQWFLSFLLARNVTHIALSPTHVRKQKPVHLVFISDDKSDKGAVVINVLPKETYKGPKDYLLKFSSSFLSPAFLSNLIKRQLSYDNPEDKAYVDQVLEEINLLLEGKSNSDKCAGKKFAIEDLHIKGLEGLDDKLHDYFQNELSKKYGDKFIEKPRKIKLDFFTLETPDGAVLDSVAVSAKNENQIPISQRKFVVDCMARNQNYINWIKDFNYSAEAIGCTVIGFNYRGVDYSKGLVWTQENMIKDALSQVQRLLDLGAKAENIGLEGMSLGGAVATIAAGRLHGKGFKVKLFNERSFQSIPRLVTGYIMPDSRSNPWNPVNWLRYLVAGVVYSLLVPVMWIVGWDLDAAKSWDKIPVADKDYAVVRDHVSCNPEQYQEDEMIHDSWASMAAYIDKHKEHLRQKHKTGERLTAEEDLLLGDHTARHEFKGAADKAEHKNTPLHFIPRRFLVNTCNNEEMMHDFMISSFKQKFNFTHNTSSNESLIEASIPILNYSPI